MMTDSERAALVEELADLMQDHAPEIETHWVALVHNGVMPILDRVMAERDAQIRYLRGYAISKAAEVMTAGNNGNQPTQEQLRYLIGGIDGNIAVAGARAATQQPHHGAQPAFPEYGEGEGL